jgi:two-component system cell cycle sensor histidine kinase/response regulator CckA
MPHGGELVVRTSNVEVGATEIHEHPFLKAGRYVMLSVSDTGCGMDEATQTRIFEPFFTTKDPGKGTGLGLSTVYGIVKQTGGYICVHSRPGKGTRFTIYLPPVEGVAQSILSSDTRKPTLGGSETILVLEDEESLRTLIADTLRANGYNVLQAQEGNAALDLAKNQELRIDLFLADVILPGVSGRYVAEQLLASRPTIKVLYMSGYTDDYINHRGVIGPEVMLLEKPFSLESLLLKVREVLDKPEVSAATA